MQAMQSITPLYVDSTGKDWGRAQNANKTRTFFQLRWLRGELARGYLVPEREEDCQDPAEWKWICELKALGYAE